MTPRLCIGGSLDGKLAITSELPPNEYVPYNCAVNLDRRAYRKAAAVIREKDVRLPPSVFLHLDLFGE